jgi:gliding motility-associated-like protein
VDIYPVENQIKYLLLIALLIIGYLGQAQEENVTEYRVLAMSNADEVLYASSNYVEVALPLNINMPTAFSPNGDGLNDTFGLVGDGVETFRLLIFNRWGEIVFETTNRNERWDGLYKGITAPVGVYGYELIAKNAGNKSIVKKGSVTLVN